MTRIIAGVAGGRRLVVPAGRATRPTSDRAREALFSALEALVPGGLAGARVLDLYAGSGALGLEALSRGAAHALLVESDAKALVSLRANVAALGLPGAEVVGTTVARALARPAPEPFDVLVADPPYVLGAGALAGVLAEAYAAGWLAPGAVAVVERSSRDPAFAWPAPFTALRSRRYGEAQLWYGRAGPAPDDTAPTDTAPTDTAPTDIGSAEIVRDTVESAGEQGD